MEVLFSVAITTLVFSIIALCLGIYAMIEIKAFKNSTHKIQILNPATQEFSALTETEKKGLQKDYFDNI